MRRAACAVIVAAVAAACSVPDAPNLLIVSLDTTRRDHTSLHGYTRDTTPHLRALAAEGARFELAYAPTSTTAPTHATLFTGRDPIAHGVRKNGVPLPREATTLAEELRAAGWDTAGFVSSYVLTRRFGFAQGFSHWDEEFPAEGATSKRSVWEGLRVRGGFDRRGDVTTDRALRWLGARSPRRPFFLFVHYYDPHAPYEAPPGAARFEAQASDELAQQVAAYDAEIRFADAQLGRLLEALPEASGGRRTLVLVTADHGEGLLQHGLMGHGLQIYEEQVRIPLVAHLPGTIPAATALEGPVEMVDLLPTVRELLGLPEVPTRGASLAPALRGDAELATERPVFLYRRQFTGAGEQRGDIHAVGEKFGVREGRWKYIEGPEEGTLELFDLWRDPGERRNVHAWRPREAKRLAERVADWRQSFGQRASGTPRIAEDVRDGLEALGYVE